MVYASIMVCILLYMSFYKFIIAADKCDNSQGARHLCQVQDRDVLNSVIRMMIVSIMSLKKSFSHCRVCEQLTRNSGYIAEQFPKIKFVIYGRN